MSVKRKNWTDIGVINRKKCLLLETTTKGLLGGGGLSRPCLGKLVSVNEQAGSTYGSNAGGVDCDMRPGPSLSAKGLLGGGGEFRPRPG